MLVRCWGSRGSIPVNGKDFLKYGGDTTCMEVRSESGDLIIIDSGSGIRLLGESIIKEGVENITILFTHAHWDHLLGFPFFRPLFMSKFKIDIRSLTFHKTSVRSIFKDLLARPYHPVQLTDKDVKAKLSFKKINSDSFTIGSMKISTIPLSHPKDSGVGYKFEENGKKFVFITDNELGHIHNGGKSIDEYAEFSKDADLLIHDAQYTREEYDRIMKVSEVPWGHSASDDAVKLAIKAGVKELGLFHIDPSHSDKFVDTMAKDAKSLLQSQGSKIPVSYLHSGYKASL